MEELIKQRVLAMALGYEDLNDHDSLRHDVVMDCFVRRAIRAGAIEFESATGKAIAGKSTLNRLELTPEVANETVATRRL